MCFIIREATSADISALAHLHVETFNETHVGPFGKGPTYELRERQWSTRRHVARRFLSQGISSMLLFGEARNPSNGFYEAMAAEKLFAANGEFHGGYGWRDLRRLVNICPADE